MTDTTRAAKRTFSQPKQRHFLALFLALITATVMIPGMTTYLPLSAADQVAIPILLFPFIWTGLFVYAYLAPKAWHATLLMVVLTLLHGALSYVNVA
ncbi:hypothetical protein IC617_15000 [Neiella sp. HB171785]|uniref:Uncharacterized protein n=1 Tax=Neiella litorisoli TaxID=2771431 RepID=A0A8J6UQB2_9GAMM|nr:hypothetical protein [Neiella litorisoli]MBD1390737.1 hypothetical protein [Neiella litorisoli]